MTTQKNIILRTRSVSTTITFIRCPLKIGNVLKSQELNVDKLSFALIFDEIGYCERLLIWAHRNYPNYKATILKRVPFPMVHWAFEDNRVINRHLVEQAKYLLICLHLLRVWHPYIMHLQFDPVKLMVFFNTKWFTVRIW